MCPSSGTSDTNRYDQDVALIKTNFQWVLLTIGLIFALSLPFLSGAWLLHQIIRIEIIAISLIGLNIITGYAGQFNLGQVAFMGVGGYTSAILVERLGFSFWLALPCGAILAAIVGMIFGVPSLRLKGFYLAMSTLAAHFIIAWVLLHWTSVTGGSMGQPAPPPHIGDFIFDSDRKYFYVVIIILIIMTYLAVNLTRTRVGRIFISIRDNEIAAEMLGINVAAYKILAFGICCFYAGIAGSLMSHWYSHLTVDLFSFHSMFWFYGMLVVGGLGSNLGLFLGASAITLIDESLVLLVSYIGEISPGLTAMAVPVRGMVYGLIIVLMLIFQPRGLAHLFEQMKSSIRLHPVT